MVRSGAKGWFFLCFLLSSCVRIDSSEVDQADQTDQSDPSIVLGNKWPSVENGSAFDLAEVDLKGIQRIVLPLEAKVRQEGKSDKAQVFMKKVLAYRGHPGPGAEMSIRAARKKMSLHAKTEQGVLFLATQGEWRSIEGGAKMSLVVVAPENVRIERIANLGGAGPVRSEDAMGRKLPGEGWRVVPDQPDLNHRADR